MYTLTGLARSTHKLDGIVETISEIARGNQSAAPSRAQAPPGMSMLRRIFSCPE